jgi:hypothetical protein
LIADRSSGTIARRNTIIAPQRPDGTGVRIGFEMGGDNARCEDNYSVGTQNVVSANDFFGSTSVLVRNNRFKDYLVEVHGRGVTKHKKGGDNKHNRNNEHGRPGRNKRQGRNGLVK